MNSLIGFDHALFHLINVDGTNAFFDWFMPFWTDLHKNLLVFIPILLFLFIWTHRVAKWRGVAILISALGCGFIADFISGQVLKPIFERPRPTSMAADFEVIVRGIRYGGTSFPSSHSLDFFCIVTFLICYFPRLRIPLVALGILTAFSRVYCGAHFPLDVLGGGLIGSCLGWILFRISLSGSGIVRSLLPRKRLHEPRSPELR